MYKLSFLNRQPKEKTGSLSDNYLGLSKAIYTDPLEINTEDLASFGKPRRYLKANNEEIGLDLGFVTWLELALALCITFFLCYACVYYPIYEYNMKINVVTELAETGKSSYSEEIQKEYGTESAMMQYRYKGLNELRTTSFNQSNLILLVLSVPLTIGAFYWIYLCTKQCRDRLILNRKTGKLHYSYCYGLRSQSCNFDQALFQDLKTSIVNADSSYLAIRFPNAKGTMMVSPAVPYISISMYVWFMDKNRPLPPGTAFDAYREEDYLRRKAEGFPPPIYPSGVPTPEADFLIKKYKDKQAQSRATRNYSAGFKTFAASEDQLRNS